MICCRWSYMTQGFTYSLARQQDIVSFRCRVEHLLTRTRSPRCRSRRRRERCLRAAPSYRRRNTFCTDYRVPLCIPVRFNIETGIKGVYAILNLCKYFPPTASTKVVLRRINGWATLSRHVSTKVVPCVTDDPNGWATLSRHDVDEVPHQPQRGHYG